MDSLNLTPERNPMPNEPLPSVGGRVPLLLEISDGVWTVCDKTDIRWKLYRDGLWVEHRSDEWPTRESALAFIRSLAAREAPLTINDPLADRLFRKCGLSQEKTLEVVAAVRKFERAKAAPTLTQKLDGLYEAGGKAWERTRDWIGRCDKPFHKAECQCPQCLDWIAANPLPAPQAAPPAAGSLPADVLAVCKQRNWSLHWTARGAYLHLEASELIEAIRGKRGDPTDEAGDVLIVLMSITEHAGIPWGMVEAAARAKVESLKTKPRYAGEEFVKP